MSLTRAEIESEVKVLRQRLKAIRDHYGSQESTATWADIEDTAREAFDTLGRAREALKQFSTEIEKLEALASQMVAMEREHNEKIAKSGLAEVSACHGLLNAVAESKFKKFT